MTQSLSPFEYLHILLRDKTNAFGQFALGVLWAGKGTTNPPSEAQMDEAARCSNQEELDAYVERLPHVRVSLAVTCHVCGKLKGQPPDRCPGHYEGTPSEAPTDV